MSFLVASARIRAALSSHGPHTINLETLYMALVKSAVAFSILGFVSLTGCGGTEPTDPADLATMEQPLSCVEPSAISISTRCGQNPLYQFSQLCSVNQYAYYCTEANGTGCMLWRCFNAIEAYTAATCASFIATTC